MSAGSVHASGAGEAVFVEISSVGGDLEIVGDAAGAPITITRGSVFGDLFLSRNGGSLEMTREEVGGDARVLENVSPVGFNLQENIIGRDLLFSRNSGPSALNSNSIGETLGLLREQSVANGIRERGPGVHRPVRGALVPKSRLARRRALCAASLLQQLSAHIESWSPGTSDHRG